MAKPTSEQLALINNLTLGKRFSENDVEVFKAYLVDNEITSYNTVLQDDIKLKFLSDLKEGKTALNLLHASYDVLPIGKSFDGEVENGVVYGYFYVVKDGKTVSTNGTIDNLSIVEGINSGVNSDVSVEFSTHQDDYICSICGESYYTGSCDHLAGYEYNGVRCIVNIYNKKGEAVLGAVSLVVDGAVANARFVPIEVTNESQFVGSAYSTVTVGDKTLKYIFKPGLDTYVKTKSIYGGSNMNEELKTLIEQLSATSTKLGQAEADVSKYKKDVETLSAEKEELSTKLSKVEEELSKYSTYESSFEAVKGKAKEMGIKAYGNDFNEEDFNKLSVEEVVDYYSKAVEKFIESFPSGKVSPEESTVEYTAPIGAFKA
jgi:hypothetical protein